MAKSKEELQAELAFYEKKCEAIRDLIETAESKQVAEVRNYLENVWCEGKLVEIKEGAHSLYLSLRTTPSGRMALHDTLTEIRRISGKQVDGIDIDGESVKLTLR